MTLKRAIAAIAVFAVQFACVSEGALALPAKKIVTLQPSSDWNIEFGPDRCRLSRLFGTKEEPHIVYFEQAGPSARFALTMAGKELRIFEQHFNHLSMNPGDGYPRVDHYWGEIRGIGPAVTVLEHDISEDLVSETEAVESYDSMELPAIDLDEAAKIDRIFYGHKGTAIAFETGNLSAPFQALNSCTSDFLRAWGLDQDQHAKFKSLPVLQNERDIDRSVKKLYPSMARLRGAQAIIRLVAIVEADGSMSDCWLQNATEGARFKSPACKVMQDAEFAPALDVNGEPMRSYFVKTLNYQIIPANAHG
ncbi:MAG: energy transducer TonB [Pseudomonadota bacterium]